MAENPTGRVVEKRNGDGGDDDESTDVVRSQKQQWGQPLIHGSCRSCCRWRPSLSHAESTFNLRPCTNLGRWMCPPRIAFHFLRPSSSVTRVFVVANRRPRFIAALTRFIIPPHRPDTPISMHHRHHVAEVLPWYQIISNHIRSCFLALLPSPPIINDRNNIHRDQVGAPE